MKSIIVNMVPEETCMALLEDGELQAVEMERSSHSHLVGNIYKGRVQNVLPGMQAAHYLLRALGAAMDTHPMNVE